jgi:hypothetical protein
MGFTEMTAFHRGHPITCRQDKDGVYSIWEYLDGSNLKVVGDRPCTRCGKMPSEKGHDACITDLPHVKYACCGHGREDGYVKLENNDLITFNTDYSKEKIIQLIEEHLKKC